MPKSMDREWDRAVRHETETEQLDRNWNTLIQETRVVQTGVQLLTGFLLTVPFQSRFQELSDWQRGLYLATVLASIGATIFLVAPVSAHRILFRRHRIDKVVQSAHRYAITGLALLAVALVGVAVLIFDVVTGPVSAALAGGGLALLFALCWVILPWRQRAGIPGERTGNSDDEVPQRVSSPIRRVPPQCQLNTDTVEVNLLSEHEKSGFREGFEGTVEDAKGKAKEAAGTVFGNENLRDEGRVQQERAQNQRDAAKHEAQAEKDRAEAELEEKRQRAYQEGR
ncbi:microaggregate-binding protein 1 [Nocardia inohanensis]|uniref:microaggregate-binding protein 1 n=1 Tax=Nocardia inohanensis TaxID=209246 RepID=UPI0008379E8A